MSVLRPDLMMKCVVPVIMAGIIAVSGVFVSFRYLSHILFKIYGLVVSVLIAGDRSLSSLSVLSVSKLMYVCFYS